MKKTPNPYIIIIFSLLAISAFSQTKWGIKGGFNFSNQYIEIGNREFDDTEGKLGLQLGVVADIPFRNSNFGVQPGTFFISKGYRADENNAIAESDLEVSISYLHIPIPFTYTFETGKADLFLGAGPYISFALGGSVEVEGDVFGFGFEEEEDLDFGNDDSDDYRGFDQGLILIAGIKFSNAFQADISYEAGFANILSDPRNDDLVRNRSVIFSFTYFFN